MKRLIGSLIIAMLTAFALEVSALLILKGKGGHYFSPLLNFRRLTAPEINYLRVFAFDEVDPLLGWSMSENTIVRRGFDASNGMAILKTSECDSPLIIFITGGSTSDIALHQGNWPVHLSALLKKEHLCAEIYIGATGGYNSGQELLKLIRDGLPLSPDIHISYSGANEYMEPSYVTRYENDLFSRLVYDKSTTVILPNIVFLARKISGLNVSLELKQSEKIAASAFWHRNMMTMHDIAKGRQSVFAGILQPVLGTGSYTQGEISESSAGFIRGYQIFYPDAREIASKHDFIYDFTSLFDGMEHQDVYIDDCHINEQYQPVVAQAVFEVIKLSLH